MVVFIFLLLCLFTFPRDFIAYERECLRAVQMSVVAAAVTLSASIPAHALPGSPNKPIYREVSGCDRQKYLNLP